MIKTNKEKKTKQQMNDIISLGINNMLSKKSEVMIHKINVIQ